MWFFSNLVEEEGPRIPGGKDSSVCFLKTLTALSVFQTLYLLFARFLFVHKKAQLL